MWLYVSFTNRGLADRNIVTSFEDAFKNLLDKLFSNAFISLREGFFLNTKQLFCVTLVWCLCDEWRRTKYRNKK